MKKILLITLCIFLSQFIFAQNEAIKELHLTSINLKENGILPNLRKGYVFSALLHNKAKQSSFKDVVLLFVWKANVGHKLYSTRYASDVIISPNSTTNISLQVIAPKGMKYFNVVVVGATTF